MDIRGNEISLTGSEADYVQRTAACDKRFDLAQRILAARAAFARKHLGDAIPEPLPPIDPGARTGAPSQIISLILDLARAETEHGRDERGVELHAIHTTMKNDELDWLRENAAVVEGNARAETMDFSVHYPEPGATPQGEVSASPEQVREFYFKNALTQINVAGGIVRAIDAARGTPPEQPQTG